MKFRQLLQAINHTHISLQSSAVKAINNHLTCRNWLIGYYIVEFEQKGEDRAVMVQSFWKKLQKKLQLKD